MPKKHKGNAKAVSPNTIVTTSVNRTLTEHRASQKGQNNGRAAASSSSDHHDGVIELCDYGDFDYDAVKADDGVELWLVRTPSAVRPVPVLIPLFLLLIPLLS